MDTCKHGDEPGTVSLDEAVRITGLDRKRLAGRIWRDSIRHDDPRGCKVCGRVYVDSLRAVRGSAVINGEQT